MIEEYEKLKDSVPAIFVGLMKPSMNRVRQVFEASWSLSLFFTESLLHFIVENYIMHLDSFSLCCKVMFTLKPRIF